MGWFPFAEDPQARGAGGSLVYNPDFYKPSSEGVLIYFSSKNIDQELDRVEKSGGVVVRKKDPHQSGNWPYGSVQRFRREPDRLAFKEVTLRIRA